MTDTMVTTIMIMTVMEDVVEEDDRVINTRITHSIHSTHFSRSTHHSIAHHTIDHTATNINKVPTQKNWINFSFFFINSVTVKSLSNHNIKQR